ncbi:SAP-like protein BP-73 [Ananas comosus]|uniref:SAP-like protein BP-73 n=1 Tax=Ananas comosus TaxID=4615 RepID=A0A199VIG8_ANACO|nr:SAP-like protein BP-73 [Ananas comosus]
MSSARIHLVSDGYTLTDRKGTIGRATVPVCNGDRFFRGAIFLRKCSTYAPKRISFVCSASSNSHRRNPDFSRQQKGSSRGRGRQYQEREYSDNVEETDPVPSKNGPLLSLTSNPRHQATATPGRREKEIVELFRKVQAQLRERAAIKEEKKIETAQQQGQGERGTVDSLLKLLRKHSVDRKKKNTVDSDYNMDQPERSSTFEDEQNSNYFIPNNDSQEEVHEPDAAPFSRPASNFRRRSPVPKVKFQPIFSADEGNSFTPFKTAQGKKTAIREPEVVPEAEPEPLDEPDDVFLHDQSDTSDTEESHTEEIAEPPSTVESPDLGSMKLTELREIAKSRGIKGYSKLKKGELVELLSGDSA